MNINNIKINLPERKYIRFSHLISAAYLSKSCFICDRLYQAFMGPYICGVNFVLLCHHNTHAMDGDDEPATPHGNLGDDKVVDDDEVYVIKNHKTDEETGFGGGGLPDDPKKNPVRKRGRPVGSGKTPKVHLKPKNPSPSLRSPLYRAAKLRNEEGYGDDSGDDGDDSDGEATPKRVVHTERTGGPYDITSELVMIKDLFDQGLINSEEYTKMKKEALENYYTKRRLKCEYIVIFTDLLTC